MRTRRRIRSELAEILAAARPAGGNAAARRSGPGFPFDRDFARYLVRRFGTADLSQLSDGQLARAARRLRRVSRRHQF